MKVTFVGLGAMGYHMAGHLVKKGHAVTVYNRTPATAAAWTAEFGGTPAKSLEEAVAGADVVVTCLGDGQSVLDVLTCAGGVFSGIRPGAVVIDHSTIAASDAELIGAECEKRGVHFLDAPISGGQVGAEKGMLTVMVGGKEEVYDSVRSVLSAYSLKTEHFGPIGNGQRCKMVNQICVAGVVQGLAEGIHFAKRAGLDEAKLFGLIQHGAAGSWQMTNRHKSMASGDFEGFGFKSELMLKDLNIVLDESTRNGANLPVTEIIGDRYQELKKAGRGHHDCSALVTLLDYPKPTVCTPCDTATPDTAPSLDGGVASPE